VTEAICQNPSYQPIDCITIPSQLVQASDVQLRKGLAEIHAFQHAGSLPLDMDLRSLGLDQAYFDSTWFSVLNDGFDLVWLVLISDGHAKASTECWMRTSKQRFSIAYLMQVRLTAPWLCAAIA